MQVFHNFWVTFLTPVIDHLNLCLMHHDYVYNCFKFLTIFLFMTGKKYIYSLWQSHQHISSLPVQVHQKDLSMYKLMLTVFTLQASIGFLLNLIGFLLNLIAFFTQSNWFFLLIDNQIKSEDRTQAFAALVKPTPENRLRFPDIFDSLKTCVQSCNSISIATTMI